MPGENVYDWSTTAANNASADSSISWIEAQSLPTVNNSMRSVMAAIAKRRNLENGSITTGGAADAQTFSSGLSYSAYPSGLLVRLKLGFTNTGAVTLNMDGIGAKNIATEDGAALAPAALVAGAYAEFVFSSSLDKWVLLRRPEYSFGTWTPTLTFATPGNLSVAYSTRAGTWTQLGRLVTITWEIVTSTFTHTTASGDLKLTGFPFTLDDLSGRGAVHWGGITFAGAHVGMTDIAALIVEPSDIKFIGSGPAEPPDEITAADMPTGGTVTLLGSI
jgi:hypothetical protein